jgi:transketolase
MHEDFLIKQSRQIRRLMIEVIRAKETHHIGCALGIVEILTYLYFHQLNINPKNPNEINRDIFLLSKGHAALALYATLCQRGFFSKQDLLNYDKDGSFMPEHAATSVVGVEWSTGSLGHALPVAIGLAYFYKTKKKKNRVFVLLSDGELNEGSNWEAFMFAGFHKLDNLTVIIDNNNFQGFGKIDEVINLSPLPEKFKLFGWTVVECDGHQFKSLNQAFNTASLAKPKMIIAHTIKGKGVAFFENKFFSHYQSIDEKMKEEILKNL